jgi:4'-phosphopantetheinyl transferase
MITTYLMQTDIFNDSGIFQEKLQTVSLSRQKKISAFLFQKEKNLSLAAGLLLQAGLQKYGLDESLLKIDTYKNGKPFLKNYPEIHFNISHSEKIALCSFSNRNLGADIEVISPIDLKIAKEFFYDDEYQTILNSKNPKETFFDYWVLKESYMKATGLGFKLPLNAFQIKCKNNTINVFENMTQMPYSFYKATIFNNYKLGLCINGAQPKIETYLLSYNGIIEKSL